MIIVCQSCGHFNSHNTFEDRFWNQVDRRGSCWIWVGQTNEKGYGYFSGTPGQPNKKFYAHRVSWSLVHGEIPKGMHVCHKCDNPRCCNPEHLFLGTPKDNAQDMIRKGRQGDHVAAAPKGEAVVTAKLTEVQVREIITLSHSGTSFSYLAKAYNVSPRTISNIVRGKSWRHVSR